MSISLELPLSATAPAAAPISRSYWLVVWRQLWRDPMAMASTLVLLIIIGAAVFAPWLAPADPYKASMLRRLLPIGSDGYLFGTDELGRDMLTRLM